MKKYWVMYFILVLGPSAWALKVGDHLENLSFKAQPDDFVYRANGSVQVITVYPAKPSSKKNGKLNRKLQTLGICPLAITDIKNKAWYAPIALIESEMKKEVESDTHNPDCPVSGDYTGQAVLFWGLNPEMVVIVVDGEGRVVYMHYGIVEIDQEKAIIEFFH